MRSIVAVAFVGTVILVSTAASRDLVTQFDMPAQIWFQPADLWEMTQPHPDTMLDKFVPIPNLIDYYEMGRYTVDVWWSWDWTSQLFPQDSFTSLLGRRPTVALFEREDWNPIARSCEGWRKCRRFEYLRSCILSVARNGTPKAQVVAMLGPGQRVTVPDTIWDPPREAYSYTPADRENFHYVVVYRDDVVVEVCCYSLDSDGRLWVELG